jgi:hypothetical protein
MRLEVNITHMGNVRNACTTLIKKSEGKRKIWRP